MAAYGLFRQEGLVALARGAAALVFVVALTLLAAVAVPAPARATTLERLSIEQLSRRAVAVVEGTVVSTSAARTPAGVRTAVRIRVRESLKGVAADFLTVYVPGGTLADGARVVVDAMASFRPGDSCYVFADTRGWVVGGFQGKLGVTGGRLRSGGASTAATSRRIRAAVRGARSTADEPAVAAPEATPAPPSSPGASLSAGPAITSITPGEASAGTGTYVSIRGTGFGAAGGRVYFSYGRDGVDRIRAADVRSWSATRIECAVPTGVIADYSASAGSGPVVVVTSGGRESDPYDFTVSFGYGGHKWAKSRATYYVNTSGTDKALRESLVDAAAGVWNVAGSGFQFLDGGVTTSGKARDSRNVISWANGLPDGVIGQSSSYYTEAGFLLEADVQFNNAYAWGTGARGSGTMDVESVALHEIGHWLRLLDLYMPADAGKVMYGYGDEDEQKRTLAAGDVTGITWVYPNRPVDDVGPVCAAKKARVRRGGTVKLYFKVYDADSAEVTKKLVISTAAGREKQKWTWGYDENYDGWWFVTYKCTLKPGTYQLVVSGKDLAGNDASKVGQATLTVK